MLDRLFAARPLPETVIRDNGPEFASTALDAWAAQHGGPLHFIQPGKPGPNAFISAVSVLNAKDAEDMRNGFRAELYNARGVHWADPTEKPERELSVKYRAQAEAVEGAGYPRLAATLRQLAETYKREAESVSQRDPFDD